MESKFIGRSVKLLLAKTQFVWDAKIAFCLQQLRCYLGIDQRVCPFWRIDTAHNIGKMPTIDERYISHLDVALMQILASLSDGLWFSFELQFYKLESD